LTDEGLRAELEAHKIEVADHLALDDEPETPKRHKKRKKK
jgi:hypothetical protein